MPASATGAVVAVGADVTLSPPMTATTLLTGDGLAFLDPDLGQHAGSRRRNLRVDLVGGNLEQRLVAVDRSPTFLIQRTIVPSAIDSPIWGITTLVGIRPYDSRFQVLGF